APELRGIGGPDPRRAPQTKSRSGDEEADREAQGRQGEGLHAGHSRHGGSHAGERHDRSEEAPRASRAARNAFLVRASVTALRWTLVFAVVTVGMFAGVLFAASLAIS